EAVGLPGRAPRGRLVRAHRRRARAALAAARAVHRRRPGHEDRRRRMTPASLQELVELERDYAIGTYVRNPVQFVRGERCTLWDSDGNEFLDFLAGISVVNVGHCHPRVVEAVREQVGMLSHTTNLYYTEPAMRLSAELSRRSLAGKVFLCNSGAEA